jgi:hypothetical protein
MTKAMQKRAQGTVGTVQQLLTGGMGGQLRTGDSIGLWTYNDELYAGMFPVQQWTPKTHRHIVARILAFLQEQKFEKSADLQKVLPSLEGIIKDSEYITVVLISDGSEKIHGTPYDARINDFYKIWRSEQQNAHMPFVTILRAKAGKFTDFTVNPAQWSLEMPPLPAELQKVEVAQTKPPESKKASPPMAQPLIISGRKPELAPGPAPTATLPLSATPTIPADGVKVTGSPTNPVVGEQSPIAQGKLDSSPVTPPVEITKPPETQTSEKGPVQTELSSVPAPAPPTVAPPADVQVAPPNPISPSAATTELQTAPTPQSKAPALARGSHTSVSQSTVTTRSRWLFGGVGLVVLVLISVAVIAGVLLSTRRAKPVGSASLITRSFDRKDS